MCQFFQQTGMPPKQSDYPLLDREYQAVQRILEKNECSSIKVEEIVSVHEGRVTDIHLGSFNLSEFILTNDIDSLHSSLLLIKLDKNDLIKFFVHDTIKRHFSISLFGNRLSFLNADLSKLIGDIHLDVRQNYIEDIAPEVLYSGITDLKIDQNRLCNISDSIKLWLTELDSSWEETQICD